MRLKAYDLKLILNTHLILIGCFKNFLLSDEVKVLNLKVFKKCLKILIFSGLSDSENQKRAIAYVCAIKNELVRRTIMKLSLTHYNHFKDHSKYKF